jgi:hypothetical protein
VQLAFSDQMPSVLLPQMDSNHVSRIHAKATRRKAAREQGLQLLQRGLKRPQEGGM